MGFRPNTKGVHKQPKTGIGSAFRAKKKYIRKARKAPTKKLVRTNAYTIASLLKRVRINELDKHGCLQTNKQIMQIIPINPVYPGAQPDVRVQFPILFNVTNFGSQEANTPLVNTARCPIFQMKQNTALQFLPTEIGDFQRFNYQGVATPTETLATSLWIQRNNDIPDTGKYYAQSSVYRITINCAAAVRVKIQFFTQKPLSLPSSVLRYRNLVLPGALDGLGYMAAGNQFPRTGFKIYREYEKIMDPVQNQTSTQNTFYFSFNHNKQINQYQTKPATVDSEIPYPLTGWNYNNIPALQPLWCLVSSNMPNRPGSTGDTSPVFVSISRSTKWRDPIGADN